MNTEINLRRLSGISHVVTVFAVIFLVAGLAEIGLGGMAINDEYARIAEVEAQQRQAFPYGGYYPQSAAQAEYNRSSSAFLAEGRFLPSLDEVSWTDPGAIALIVLLLAAAGFMVAALAWVWRAHANLAQLGRGTKYAPGMIVASYLIPVANLVLPFEAMRELHNRSNGEPEELVHAPVEDVTAWWTAMLVGLLIFSALVVKFGLDLGTNVAIMTPLWMEYAIGAFAVLLMLASALLFSGLARKITRAQAEYLPAIEHEDPPAAAQPRADVTIRTSQGD